MIHIVQGKIVLIDEEDEPIFQQYKWHISDSGYVIWRGKKGGRKQTIRLHRLIAKPDEGLVVDHINRNKLDNRKANLRCVTQAINTRNSARVINARGYYYSSSKCRRNNKWVVDFNGVCVTFRTEEEAKSAVAQIRAGTFIKRKDIIHERCPKCGAKKQWYGGVWQCRECALERHKKYRKRAVASGKIQLHPREKKIYCLNGHPRVPENLTKNGTCKECARERSQKWRDQKRIKKDMK